MCSIGGQRAERRKWLHVFSGIDVVIYVMSLSAYDQVLFEDHTTRCWDETLSLFEKTASNKSFKETDFIVFLNKDDIFQNKIQQISFNVYNPDFPSQDSHNAEKVQFWIREQLAYRFYHPYSSQQGMITKHNSNNNGYTINYGNQDEYIPEEEEQKYDYSKPNMNYHTNSTRTGGKKRGLHFHVTCATDTDQITAVFRVIQIELIRKLMTKAGLM